MRTLRRATPGTPATVPICAFRRRSAQVPGGAGEGAGREAAVGEAQVDDVVEHRLVGGGAQGAAGGRPRLGGGGPPERRRPGAAATGSARTPPPSAAGAAPADP